MKQQILTMLRTADGYVSGQEICEKLNVSRTTVWKIIKQLQKQGYEIEGIKNRGYRLLSTPDILTAEEIKSQMGTDSFVNQVLYFPVTDSTNIQARQCAEKEDSDRLLVVANEQTKGRGRMGRHWDSLPEENIFMSLLLKPKINPKSASMLTIIAALAVAAAIRENTDLESWIKWPNDIVINKKKVCGILTEMNSELDYIHYVIIGIGINVNTIVFPEEIAQTATSLLLESEKKQRFSRSQLLCSVMAFMKKYYEKFLETQDLSLVKEEYNQRLAGLGEQVKILRDKTECIGISRGITKTGQLIVEYSDGSKEEVFSGEVSVRGLYGYV